MNLVDTIKDIQRAVGADVDGVFGPRTGLAVLRELKKAAGVEPQEKTEGPTPLLDARSAKCIATLDKKFQPRVIDFILRAKATAATMGCDYVVISGGRSWAEQAALFEASQQGGAHAAPPGSSWHNFGCAFDAGVFRGKAYLDESEPQTAYRVHRACMAHADNCGLLWGGTFSGKSADSPHWQALELPKSPTNASRARYKAEGSVL